MRRSSLRADKYGNYAYLFIAPFFLVFLVFSLYPMIYSFVISFYQWPLLGQEPKYVGFANYQELIKDTLFLQSLINTIIMWVGGFIPQMFFALVLAGLLTDDTLKIKGKSFFRATFYLPNIVTMASVSALFYYVLYEGPSGFLNFILTGLGVISAPVSWTQDFFAMRSAISFMGWWMWFGYSMIIFMAGIKSISADIFEAATIDGASRWQTFWKVTIPCIRPTILYSFVTSVIGGLTMFDLPYVLTQGEGSPLNKTLTMTMYIYNTTFRTAQDMGIGSSLYVGMFFIVSIFAALMFKILNNKDGAKR